MRTHGDYALVQLWPDRDRARRLMRADSLAAIRFELIERDADVAGWIDLVFAAGGATYVLPGVLAQLSMVAGQDPGALLWPRESAVAADAVPAIADRVLAHVGALFRGEMVPSERAIELVACEPFRAARARGELGAAPLGTVLPRMAPWIYAGRSATGIAARIAGGDAALGAAVLRGFGIASEIAGHPDGLDWYGVVSQPCSGAPALVVDETGTGDARLALRRPAIVAGWREIPITAPRPMDVAFAFDERDERAGSFWVREKESARSRVAAEPVRASRIGARLALVARDDVRADAEADTDQIDAIAEQFGRALGAEVRILRYAEDGEAAASDLTVVFGDLSDAGCKAALQRAAARERPFLVVPEPFAPYAAWYEAALAAMFHTWDDDEATARSVAAFDAGAFDAGVPFLRPPGVPEAEPIPALARASAVVIGPNHEQGKVAVYMAGSAAPSLAALPLLPATDSTGEVRTGAKSFAFAHASATPRSGLLLAAFALRDTSVPFVIATTGADAAFCARLRRVAGPYTTVLVDPSVETIDGLYREAGMFVDLSLRPRGPSRLLRALRAGALPVVMASSPLASFFVQSDLIPRAALESVRHTLVRLWKSPLRQARAQTLARASDALLGTGDPFAEIHQLFVAFAPGFGLT